MNWQGKIVIVTGGAVGIGAATVKLFAEHGAKTVIFDPDNAAAATQVAAITAAGGSALHVQGSVASEPDVQKLVRAASETFGRVDALINNAGIMRRHKDVPEWPMADIRQVLEINLLGVFLTSYALAPVMARNGGGAIVNISSLGGLICVPYSPAYSAAKAGVLGMTRSMAPSFSSLGVRVNAILPSLTNTPMVADFGQSMPMLEPLDIARAILHVASEPVLTGAFFAIPQSGARPELRRVADVPEFLPVENSPFQG